MIKAKIINIFRSLLSIIETQNIKKEIEQLRKQIEYHKFRYYVLQMPEITDNEYDSLKEKLKDMEAKVIKYESIFKRIYKKITAICIIAITLLAPLFAIFQGIASIVGIVWLFFLGEWKLVFLSFGVIIFFTFFLYPVVIFGLFRFPLLLLSAYFAEKKKKTLATIAAIINIIVAYGINFVWVIVVFRTALICSIGQNPIPYLLIGWDVAVVPFQFMASKEPPDDVIRVASAIAVYLTAFFYFILTVLFFLGIFAFY